ncbi:tryptophan halogenase family protein [Caulobacter hibisci]|uniref:Tryptophan 7-halogenase n=1 Tax=Caulobacter hibisci TaxID=2035993 RepID=A0ABS0SSX8_9CAUL|nr:tryptophan halogenase family protein [Caulobacter hibisci]MBI1682757.1 tryptophan 7-halogenase [Caulobacter hibisci]
MSSGEPLDIVIVGGGTAGWMVGTALVSGLRPNQARVRLVESDDIATVGVGEATIPAMRDYNRFVGIDEVEMLRATNGTFKLGIEFLDWGFQGSNYHHPFGVHGQAMGGAAFHQQWNRARLAGHDFDIEEFSYAIAASRADRFEFPNPDPSLIESSYSYAYHFDASLYAKFLRKVAEGRGLKRTEGKVVAVNRDGLSGDVASITLASGEVVKGDFFVDCTGFRGLLIGQTLESPFEDWSHWLPCDRAWAVPCARGGRLTPFTRSTAREAGWIWRIPLQHRSGNGYVYSSAHISDDEAAAVLMGQLDGEALDEPRQIRFKAGRRTASWTRNVMAAGLASGFLEPLESTSIYLVQAAVMNLLKLFPGKRVEPALVDEFNRRIDREYDRVRDFLILHYHANTRTDAPLWKQCREMEIPDSLKQKLELFRRRGHAPSHRDGLFSLHSWTSLLLGQGVTPEGYDRLADNVPLSQALAEMERQRAAITRRVPLMPSHADFVARHCAVPARTAEVVA